MKYIKILAIMVCSVLVVTVYSTAMQANWKPEVIEKSEPLDEAIIEPTHSTNTFHSPPSIPISSTSAYRDFWLAWPTTFPWLPPDGSAQIIIESESDTMVTVSGAASWSGMVSPGSPEVVNLPFEAKITTNREVEDKGIHVTSLDADLRVQFRVPQIAANSDDMYLSIPTDLLGRDYFVISYVAASPYHSEFVVLGTENSTTFTFLSTTVTLNRGQTYQYQISGGDVTGIHITSDKPIAVISGSELSYIPDSVSCCADTILEQMMPVETWGTDYLTAPLLSPARTDVIRIVSSRDSMYYTVWDDTVVTVDDGSTTTTYRFDYAGEWKEIGVEPAAHITSNYPIGVAQYARGYYASGEGDPFEMLIMPSGRFLNDYRFYIPDGYDVGDPEEGAGSYVTVIAPIPGVSVYLDGVLQTLTGSVPGGGKYATIMVYPGEHTITADHPIGVYCHGYKKTGSYGYPAGFEVLSAPIPSITHIYYGPFNTMNLWWPSIREHFRAYIELPSGSGGSGIDPTTVTISHINGNPVNMPAEIYPTELGDYDGDLIPDLMVTFNPQELGALLRAMVNPPATVELLVSGITYDGVPFEGSDNLRIIEKGPRELKLDAISELETAKINDKKIDKKINKAIDHIERSLDYNLWLNDSHLDSGKGKKVFNEAKNVVKKLEKIIEDNNVPDLVVYASKTAIVYLAIADQLLVEIALADAYVFAGTDERIDEEISKAENELETGLKELEKRNAGKAIGHYGKAWEHAQKALRHA